MKNKSTYILLGLGLLLQFFAFVLTEDGLLAILIGIPGALCAILLRKKLMRSILWTLIQCILLVWVWRYAYPHRNPESEIYSSKGPCKIENPIFEERDSNRYFVFTGTQWYPVDFSSHWLLEDILEEVSATDSSRLLQFREEYKQNAFFNFFANEEPDILQGDPNHLDNWSYYSGFYRHSLFVKIPKRHIRMCEKERGLEYEREWKLPCINGYFREDFGFLVYYLAKFGTSSDEPRDEYRLCRKYCIDSPLLYVPSQSPGIGYVFSEKVIENLGFVTEYLGDQNYYAKAIVLPSDIEQYGEVVSRDDSGVLFKLRKNSIKCNVRLVRITRDAPVYAMLLKYHNAIPDTESINDLYEEDVFVRLRQMLSVYARDRDLAHRYEVRTGFWEDDTTNFIVDAVNDSVIYYACHNRLRKDTLINGYQIFIEDVITEECSDRIVVCNPEQDVLRAYNMVWCFRNRRYDGYHEMEDRPSRPYVIESLDVETRTIAIRFHNDDLMTLELHDDYVSGELGYLNEMGLKLESHIINGEAPKSSHVQCFLAEFPNIGNNVEQSEWANELLFKLLEKFPEQTVVAISRLGGQQQEFIYNELSRPIHDGIDISLIYDKLKSCEFNKSGQSLVHERVLDILNRLK